jgi:hypothetical protein
MKVNVNGLDCFVRGRMDAVASEDAPRVIDYKYAAWRDDGQPRYEVQMSAYCLAVMKGSGARRATAEVWYLRKPMKIVRQEFTEDQAEQRIAGLLGRYVHSLSSGSWPAAERSYCDSVQCGFREQCWAK